MDINNGWLDSLTYHPIDHQQQTYVTKHDLALLHKKIIATDLIVQKYQEVNKALLGLQIENDELKQQIEQITNECCIFGKQVTECTQECDHLQEQIEILNVEKRELHNQLRLLQDENTNFHHEIMVLKQYESLKERNDQLTKNVERQQKDIAKLQLKLQRKSPLVYKPNKTQQEPTETDIALINSQKSVRELKLALGRLMNFIQTSKIEIPTSFHIRPVLKAHEINDDFLEIEGEYILKPVKKVSKPIVNQIDDDDDDDNGDFIDINPILQSVPVDTTHSSVNIIEEIPISSKSSLQQQEKKKEIIKKKNTKKSSTKKRRKKTQSISENISTKLDDLANELELALSKSDQQYIPQLPSFLSDDDDDNEDEDKIQKTDKQQLPIPIYTPIILQQPIIHQENNYSTLEFDSLTSITPKSTISFSKNLSFFSDDDNDEKLQELSPATPVFTPIIEQQPISSSINKETISSLQLDNLTPIEIEPSNKPTTYISFLSEDDDNNKTLSSPISTSIIDQKIISSSSINQEFIPPLDFQSLLNKENNDLQTSDEHSILSTNTQIETISENIQDDSSFNEKNQTISPISIDTLDSNRIEIVLRLLHILTQVPIPLKPLRLSRRRIQQRKISEEQLPIPIEDKHNDEKKDTTIIETSEDQVSLQIEEQSKPIEENYTTNITMIGTSEDQVPIEMEEQVKPIEENHTSHTTMIKTSVDHVFIQMEEQAEPIQENHTDNTKMIEIPENHVFIRMREELTSIERSHLNKEDDIIFSQSCKEQQNPIDTQVIMIEDSSIISKSHESTITEPIRHEQYLPIKNKEETSLLKSSHISIISRLLNILTNLPVKPLNLPIRYPLRKRKRKTVVIKPSVTLPQRTSYLPNRMQTRSLNTIQACIARCNRPTTINKKRTASQITSSSSSPPIAKRIKSTIIEHNEYEIFDKFINSFSKEINDELKNFINQKLHDDILLFINNFYKIINEIMIKKCNIILPLVKHLHSYEESIKVLLIYIHNKSIVFQQHFMTKLNQIFEYEIKQKQIHNNRIKIFNRLFFLTCSIFASSSIVIYTRLFDIGYYFSHDILIHSLSFISNICSSLISNDNQINSSNILLHQILFDILQQKTLNISIEYLENLIISYYKNTYDQEDLIRSFILISRHQSWLWCSNELCSKFLLQLLQKIDKQQQGLLILIILQYILFIYKDNENFKQDIIFHDQIKQLLISIKTMNTDECIVRDKIFFILHTYC